MTNEVLVNENKPCVRTLGTMSYQDLSEGIVNPDSVAAFFVLEIEWIAATTEQELVEIAAKIGRTLTDPSIYMTDHYARKQFITEWFSQIFGERPKAEHHQRLLQLRQEVIQYFQNLNLPIGLMSTGSLPNGRINGCKSDIDMVCVLPHNPELVIPLKSAFRGLEEIGIIASDDKGLGPINDLQTVVETGAGYAKVLCLTQEGILVEFFMIGEKDALQVDRVSKHGAANMIYRERGSFPKSEERVTVRGDRVRVSKGSHEVPNFIPVHEIGNDIAIGYFPQQFLAGEVVDDPTGIMQDTQGRVWRSVVRSFLYHNGGYERSMHSQGIDIRDDVLFFKQFIKLFFHPIEKYSDARLGYLRDRFIKTVHELTERSNKLSLIQTVHPNGTAERETGWQKLEEAKEQRIQLIGADFDGTLLGYPYKASNVATLYGDIASHGRYGAIITARGASFQKFVLPELGKQCIPDSNPVFVGLANGRVLLMISENQRQQLWAHYLDNEAIEEIINIYQSLGVEQTEAMNTRRMHDLSLDWQGIIDSQRLAIAKECPGVWLENAKITLIFPNSHQDWGQVQSALKAGLGNGYSVDHANGSPTVDITKAMPSDGKLLVMQHLSEILGLNMNQVATFGDSPDGNDRYLLSGVQYGFTNRDDFQRIGGDKPPYKLPFVGNPTYRVHQGIKHLLS